MKKIFILIMIIIIAGFLFTAGVWWNQNFHMEDYARERTCTFYQDQYTMKFAKVVCEDGTWWDAVPYNVLFLGSDL